MKLSRGETESYRVGQGTIRITAYWDESEIIEYVLRIGKRAGGRYAGQEIVVSVQELATWLRLTFPATETTAGFDAGGNYRETVEFGQA